MPVSQTEIRESLQVVRRILDSLERKLDRGTDREIDPYKRRKEIGQQVKKG